MSVPDFQTLMLPVLKVVASGPISAAELRARVAANVGLTEEDLAELLPSGRQSTFSNRTAWANIFLQRAGLIRVMQRGVYEVTPEGDQLLAENPERIDMKFLERFPSYTEWRKRSIAAKEETKAHEDEKHLAEISTNPEEQIERSHRELTAAVEADLLEQIPFNGGHILRERRSLHIRLA